MAAELDARVAELAAKYLPLAAEILRESIRIPADHVAKDPMCGLSNHEQPRLEYMRKMAIEHKCVEKAEDCFFDPYGQIYWTVQDHNDGIPESEKKIVYFDGHTDTVNAVRDAWRSKIGPGMDAYDGLIDKDKCDYEFLKSQLGVIPPKDEWDHLIFGRGGADQLAGVVDTMIATKIMLELKHLGALKGVIVRSYGTVAEEDNDGGGPMFLVRKVFPGAKPEIIPDVVIMTEGTGDRNKGPIGIYRGQRGRMQIEVEVIGRSCHGSMPWEGLNPLEFGSAIIVEAAQKYNDRVGFKDDKFLSHGTRTASWAKLDTPSDCAVPERFVFRFDRRLTVGETPEQALADVETMDSVKRARNAKLTVNVRVPFYEEKTWTGYKASNPQVYIGWLTPEDHPAIRAAVETYKKVVTPHLPKDLVETPTTYHKEPRVDRWVFSTDGVGYPIPSKDTTIAVPETKKWIDNGAFKHPAMFGIGAGFEQNTHKIGENVDTREMKHCIAVYARFPSLFAQTH